MLTDIRAVALRTVRHNDKTSILTAWSPSLGRLSIVMGAGDGKESRRRRALTMPLAMFEAVVDVRSTHGSELLRAREIRPWIRDEGVFDVASHPIRATVAMFVAEVLSVVTREGDADAALWALVVETVDCLSNGSAAMLANLPSAFLLRLTSVLGIEPDFGDFHEGMYFDMSEGVFRTSRPMHDRLLTPDESAFLARVRAAFVSYAHAGLIRLPRPVRNRMFDLLSEYFVLHNYPLDRLRSVEVLRAVFAV